MTALYYDPKDLNQSQAGQEATKGFEGLRLWAYHDSGGVGSIGWGHTGGVKQDERITLEQAQRLYNNDITLAENVVKRAVTVKVTQAQFDALTDFVFNVGGERFERSDVLRYLNKGDYRGAGSHMMGWVHDNHHNVVPGLIRRCRWRAEAFGFVA